MLKSSRTFETINPATEEVLSSYSYFSVEKNKEIIRLSAETQKKYWMKLSLVERVEKVLALAKDLRQNADQYAALITQEMGKPLAAAKAEVLKCVLLCEVQAQLARDWLKTSSTQTENLRFEVRRQASGLSLGIMPWNFPFWQVFRFAVPALLGGNAVLLKHSEITMGSAFQLEKIFQQNLGENVFRLLIFPHEDLESLLEIKEISSVSFTGSTAAGKKIAASCGRFLKKTILELGGNDPYVVTPTARLEEAVQICARARLVNSGQSCVAGKRFFVHKTKILEFKKLLIKEVSQYKLGSPQERTTDLGPLAAKKFVFELEKQVENLLRNWSFQRVYAGEKQDLNGFYFPPQILVADQLSEFDEELFGPVFLVMSYETMDEVLDLCHRSQFGLGAGIFSQDSLEIERFCSEAPAGFVAVNDHVKSDPRFPFGGIKSSGYGREMGEYGFIELLNIKTVSFKT